MAAVRSQMSRARSLVAPVAPRPFAVAPQAYEAYEQSDTSEYEQVEPGHGYEATYDLDQHTLSYDEHGYAIPASHARMRDEADSDEYICDAPTSVRPPRMGMVSLPEEFMASESGPFWASTARMPPFVRASQPSIPPPAPLSAVHLTRTVRVQVSYGRWLLATAVASCLAVLGAFGVAYGVVHASAPDTGVAQRTAATMSKAGATRVATRAPLPIDKIDVDPTPARIAVAPVPSPASRSGRAPATAKSKRPSTPAPAPEPSDDGAPTGAKAVLDAAL